MWKLVSLARNCFKKKNQFDIVDGNNIGYKFLYALYAVPWIQSLRIACVSGTDENSSHMLWNDLSDVAKIDYKGKL